MTENSSAKIRAKIYSWRRNFRFLNEFDGVRTNNFTPLRLILALAVLFGHSFHISKTEGFHDPISGALQSTWIGAVAVNGFFILSGFLVAGSLTKHSIGEYALSRILRIYPGLMVNIMATILIAGFVISSVSFLDFFTSKETGLYFLNMTLIPGIPRALPGVFETNTATAINGSLWTLPVEALCYAALGVFGALGLIARRSLANIMFGVVFFWGFLFPETIPHPPFGHFEEWLRVTLYFALGVFFFINRQNIPLTPAIAIACLIVYFSWQGMPYYDFVTSFALAYMLFYCAYALPVLPLDQTLGDLSYGVYIYAWPVQQTAELLYPDNNPYENAALSVAVTLILAKLSWALVEKPSLKLKRKLLSQRER